MYHILIKAFAVICLAISAYGARSPLVIPGVIFDHHPFYNKNFEPKEGSLTPGIVKKDINLKSRFPELVSTDVNNEINIDGRIDWIEGFKYFFDSNADASQTTKNSGRNIPIAQNITLNWDDDKQVYVYDNQAYFPINGKGFDASNYPYQTSKSNWFYTDNKNFHFCLRLNTKFTYGGYEEFYFIGDDDVYVFINNKLAIDLGGLHSKESKSVNLKSLSLTKGETYNFDFFYCERHTTASTIRIETNMEVFCPFYDYCGVCGGDGSTCCVASRDCNDGKYCTTDKCPSATQVIASGKTFKDYCTNTPVTCSQENNACSKYNCVEDTVNKKGVCTETVTKCPAKPESCYSATTVCNPKTGCDYSNAYQCGDQAGCQTGLCKDSKCVQKTPKDCQEENGGDLCRTYQCTENGCRSSPICSQGPNPCNVTSCNPLVGTCVYTEIPAEECNCCSPAQLGKCGIRKCGPNGECTPTRVDDVDIDGNLCTIDVCDDVTGDISSTPVVCGGCETCQLGKCVPNDFSCIDGNNCTDNVCVHKGLVGGIPTGECVTTAVECGKNDADKCKIWTCDQEKGECEFERVVCEEKGNCLVGTCAPATGQCIYTDKVCDNGGFFCLVSECDEAIGCITYDKRCTTEDGRCQKGICVNNTESEDGYCDSEDYDPKPFICQTAAVVSTAVIAGVTVAGAVALGAFIYGGKKGYDYWKQSHGNSMSASTSNPLYVESQNTGVNPLYNDTPAS